MNLSQKKEMLIDLQIKIATLELERLTNEQNKTIPNTVDGFVHGVWYTAKDFPPPKDKVLIAWSNFNGGFRECEVYFQPCLHMDEYDLDDPRCGGFMFTYFDEVEVHFVESATNDHEFVEWMLMPENPDNWEF